MWQEPIFDRTNDDTLTARTGQSNIDNHKGALNYQDLNRIEENYKHVVTQLFSNKLIVPHVLRKYTELVYSEAKKLLPDGYTPVEFIESTGEQFVNTKYAPNQDTKVVLTAQLTEGSTSDQNALFGARTSNTNQFWLYWRYNDEKFALRYGNSSTNFMVAAPPLEKHVFEVTGNKLTIAGTSTIATSATFTCDQFAYLFAANNNGLVEYPSKLRLYEALIYGGTVLVRHYLPCINPEGDAGLFDLVTCEFYGNTGTGKFIAGKALPTEYEQTLVEYTDWHEQNIPWQSEIDRIRSNFNALNEVFLKGLGLPLFDSSNFLMYSEVNDWERLTLESKQLFENMEKEYLRCNTVNSGGDILL